MDLLVGKYIYEKFTVKEKFNDTEKKSTLSIANIVAFLIGCWAVYLSWTCNTAKGVSVPMKLLFAFFAWMFSIIYIIIYFIFLSKSCKTAPTN